MIADGYCSWLNTHSAYWVLNPHATFCSNYFIQCELHQFCFVFIQQADAKQLQCSPYPSPIPQL
uniref:Uncharacterized protein n=1 Tax=Arion vulgaris TaxID=1028688 RepID=A0A0B6Y355_9EUPU